MTELPDGYIRVLDKGYVGLLGVHGSDDGDVSPPSAARTSFNKRADQFSAEANSKLVHYLLRNSEFSCLRHNVMTFEIRMPLMVARQYWKYVVGSNWTEDQLGWNENSKRYITEENEFYIPEPDQWRLAPDNKKQGSGTGYLDLDAGTYFTYRIKQWTNEGEEIYQDLLERGAAPELARIATANGNYVTVQWTTSLNALLHFLDERLDSHAQYEIREYARVVSMFFQEAFPQVHRAWDNLRHDKEARDARADQYSTLLLEVQSLKEENARLKVEQSNVRKSWFARLTGG